ncbi:hypothetical protein ElyMa_004430200 [Elysia marginata]|uniref:Uncharacterized protein n=1 Tax=Elysia marginata TaxID=1093978 RepID=A0AAV4HB43_9GAST|nr:hypothetical protein ElyMa_004430200 [Elysia marginata]
MSKQWVDTISLQTTSLSLKKSNPKIHDFYQWFIPHSQVKQTTRVPNIGYTPHLHFAPGRVYYQNKRQSPDSQPSKSVQLPKMMKSGSIGREHSILNTSLDSDVMSVLAHSSVSLMPAMSLEKLMKTIKMAPPPSSL